MDHPSPLSDHELHQLRALGPPDQTPMGRELHELELSHPDVGRARLAYEAAVARFADEKRWRDLGLAVDPANLQVDEQNPHLPEPHESGEHQFPNGSYRCTRCGIYNHPAESNAAELAAPCRGRWVHSGKLRAAAEERWAEERDRPGLLSELKRVEADVTFIGGVKLCRKCHRSIVWIDDERGRFWSSADTGSWCVNESSHEPQIDDPEELVGQTVQVQTVDGKVLSVELRGGRFDGVRLMPRATVPVRPVASTQDANAVRAREACTGAADCDSGLHVHGCFADVTGQFCDDPLDHDDGFEAVRPESDPPTRFAP